MVGEQFAVQMRQVLLFREKKRYAHQAAYASPPQEHPAHH